MLRLLLRNLAFASFSTPTVGISTAICLAAGTSIDTELLTEPGVSRSVILFVNVGQSIDSLGFIWSIFCTGKSLKQWSLSSSTHEYVLFLCANFEFFSKVFFCTTTVGWEAIEEDTGSVNVEFTTAGKCRYWFAGPQLEWTSENVQQWENKKCWWNAACQVGSFCANGPLSRSLGYADVIWDGMTQGISVSNVNTITILYKSKVASKMKVSICTEKQTNRWPVLEQFTPDYLILRFKNVL